MACVPCSNSLVRFGQVKVVMETTHQTADGRSFLVLHGDRQAPFRCCSRATVPAQHLDGLTVLLFRMRKHAVRRRCDTTVHLSHAATRFLGDLLYDIFVSLNILIKAVRRLFKLPYWSLAAHVHCKVLQ